MKKVEDILKLKTVTTDSYSATQNIPRNSIHEHFKSEE